MDRRTDVKGLSRKEMWIFAFPLLFCFSAAGFPGATDAQSPIINNQPEFSNKSTVYYQRDPAPIKLRSLEETLPDEETQLVDVVIPQTPPITLNRRNITVPFPATAYDAGSVVSKGLLYSDDKGGNWHEYGPMRTVTDNDAFPFEAPRDGEYYFALHLIHQDGTHTASRAQKYLIDTGSGITADAATGGGDRMVQGLMSLTEKDGTVQQTSAGGDALTARLNENGAAPDPYAPSKNEIADVPYPGKIDKIQRGTSSSNGKPALSITWFAPYQCGMSQSEGNVTIERAPTPDGPWTPVSESAKNIDINGAGYWFEAGENDVEPFYLRTVSNVKNGGENTQWLDTLDEPLSFATAAGGGTSVAEVPPSEKKGEIQAWSDPKPENEQKIAGRDMRDSVVDKTSSVNSSAQSSGATDVVGQAQRESRQAARPQLTDPHQLSVNPIFRYGLGVFTGKDGSGNRLPDYTNAGNAPAYANQQGEGQKQELELPPPLPPRPIWMSKREYEEHQRAYEIEVQQIRYAQAQREAFEQQQKMMRNTAQGWNPNAEQATVTDKSGNEFRVSPGSVLYDDGNGNFSSTPFAGQFSNAALPEMTFPDQPLPDGQFQNVGQPIPVDGMPIGGTTMQPIPSNAAPFGDPYTPQEQAISQSAAANPYNAADMSALPNQSIIQENLPPRPDQQQ
ncbi:MAG: hypothetical protein J6S40_07630 [Thermoguttaceae bacterium]|nr:hypothetical protein [Thermoguttaceae bacterium]